MKPRSELSLAEAVCLTLVAREPRHGWSIVKALAPDGAVGRVWSLSRPLTYRALDALAAAELIAPRGSEPGAGPPRTIACSGFSVPSTQPATSPQVLSSARRTRRIRSCSSKRAASTPTLAVT